MSMEYIRDMYKVPAKPGGRVEYTGSGTPKCGTIKSAAGAHLSILLDGEKLTRKFHPTWEMRYLPDNGLNPFEFRALINWTTPHANATSLSRLEA